MREGKFADAIEHLEESVAFASGADERELLDALSCLTARCYLGMGRPKEALQGLNPALMQARRNGGPSAIKPHSIAAECFRALGDEEKTRVELRALVEAAAESADEAEQAGGCCSRGSPCSTWGTCTRRYCSQLRRPPRRRWGLAGRAAARAGRRRAAPVAAPGPSRRRGGTGSRRSRRASAGKRNERKRRDKRFLSAMAAPTHALMARMSSPRRRVSRRRSASAPERRRRRSGPRRPRRASLKIHKKTERRKAFAPWRPSATRALGGAARTALFTAHPPWARARRPRRTSRTPVRSRGRSARRRRRNLAARGTRGDWRATPRRRPRRRAGVRKGRRRRAGRGARRARGARQERRGGQSGSRGDDRRRVEREARLNRRGGARTVRFDVKFRWSLRTRNVESISPARARGRHSIMRPPVRPPPSVLIRRQGGQSGRRCVERAVGARGVFARFPPRGSRHTTCADV